MSAKTKEQPTIKLAVVDDHKLFLKGMVNLVESLGKHFTVILEANNGQDFIDQLDPNDLPDIVLVDIAMPIMDGFKTAAWLQKNYPQIEVLVITMVEDEETLIRMLRLGIKGYLTKDVEPAQLLEALESIVNKGYYYTDYVTGQMLKALTHDSEVSNSKIALSINDREMKFLELACSEYTYKEIADIMFLSAKTIDGYRDALFDKFNAKSRVGLVLFALRNNLISLK